MSYRATTVTNLVWTVVGVSGSFDMAPGSAPLGIGVATIYPQYAAASPVLKTSAGIDVNLSAPVGQNVAFTITSNPSNRTIAQGDIVEQQPSSGNVAEITLASMQATPRASIQAAIDSVNANYLATGNPGVVLLPAGRFGFEDNTKIYLRSGALVVGRGKDITVLVAKAGASHIMFTTPGQNGVADGATVNLTAPGPIFATATAALVPVSSAGFAAGDYVLFSTTAGLVGEMGRIEEVPAGGATIRMVEALHDTYQSAKGALFKKLGNVIEYSGLVGVTLDGSLVTGSASLYSYGIDAQRVGDGCRFELKTKGWLPGALGTAASIVCAYHTLIDIEDEGSGGTLASCLDMNFVTACQIKLWPHNAASVATRWNFCHGNAVVFADAGSAGSRQVKLSCSNCNTFALSTNDWGHFYDPTTHLIVPGNNRGMVFADSSHHNSIGAARARDSIEIDLWFDGNGSNTDSAFSDSYNTIGSISIGGPASSADPVSGVTYSTNIYVGDNCVGNVIGAMTPGAKMNDRSRGKGIIIGNALPVWFDYTRLVARDGTVVDTPLAGTNDMYNCKAVASGDSVMINWKVPEGYACNEVRPVIYWTNLGADNKNVRWSASMLAVAMGVDINATGLTATVQADIASDVLHKIKRTALDGIQAVNPGDMVTVVIARGTATSDLTNDAGILGIELIPA